MNTSKENEARREPEPYEAPEIVGMGPAIEITQGMGGTLHEEYGWIIPLRPPSTTAP